MRTQFKTLLLLAALTLSAAPGAMGANAAKDTKRPRVAVLDFKAKADHHWYGWWSRRGATATQDVFVTELVKSRAFRVVERERLKEVLGEQDLSESGAIDRETLVRAGKILGVKYFVMGAITEYGGSKARGGGYIPGVGGVRVGRRKFRVAMNARLIDTETGEIVWADDAAKESKTWKGYFRGIGGGVEDDAMFDRVLKPTVSELVESLSAFGG